MRSIAGSAYDLLGYVYPLAGVPHEGMAFTTPDFDNDVQGVVNCAAFLSGSWWYTACSLWTPTVPSPTWYSPPDDSWYPLKNAHMMVKLQWISALSAAECIPYSLDTRITFYIPTCRYPYIYSTVISTTSENFPVPTFISGYSSVVNNFSGPSSNDDYLGHSKNHDWLIDWLCLSVNKFNMIIQQRWRLITVILDSRVLEWDRKSVV